MKLRGLVGGMLAVLSLFAGCSTPNAPTSVASAPTQPPSGIGASAPKPPPIREFDLPTLERLGREIYRQDQLAWVATDVVLGSVGQAEMTARGGCGWVVDTTGAEPLVRFLRKNLGIVEASYDVRFPLVGKPTMETPQNPRLSDRQLARFKALAIAQDRLGEGRFPLCKGNYNFVVLDDPAGSGFLVYFLHATNVAGEVPVGGHYRISVSGDGAAVTQVDRLSVTCLTVRKDSNIPKGGKIVAAVVSHLVSDTPIETHVFLSLQEHMPFAVVTGNQRFWVVEEGRISPMAIPPDRPGINPAAK